MKFSRESDMKKLLTIAAMLALPLAAGDGHAGPDLSALDAFAAASAGKVRLIDIRTPQEWRQTGVAPGAGRVDFHRGPEVLLSSVLQIARCPHRPHLPHRQPHQPGAAIPPGAGLHPGLQRQGRYGRQRRRAGLAEAGAAGGVLRAMLI
jgi:rhodanese-related sulfurtransferase